MYNLYILLTCMTEGIKGCRSCRCFCVSWNMQFYCIAELQPEHTLVNSTCMIVTLSRLLNLDQFSTVQNRIPPSQTAPYHFPWWTEDASSSSHGRTNIIRIKMQLWHYDIQQWAKVPLFCREKGKTDEEGSWLRRSCWKKKKKKNHF